eukprot:33575-Chlamydomonas_euryale.AAC.1
MSVGDLAWANATPKTQTLQGRWCPNCHVLGATRWMLPRNASLHDSRVGCCTGCMAAPAVTAAAGGKGCTGCGQPHRLWTAA